MEKICIAEKKLPNRQKKKPKRESILKNERDKSITSLSNISFESSYEYDIDSRPCGTCLNVDCDSEPDRSEPFWKVAAPLNVLEESNQSAGSDAEKTTKKKLTLWDEIMMEYEDKRLEFDTLQELEKPFEPPLPVFSKLSAVQYLDKYVFPLLCPALSETLFKAKEWDCLTIQKCRFNGLDYIAELLWNRNPLHPNRLGKYRNIFDIPFAIIWLHNHPRPVYPLSWLWSKEEAIIILQTYIRRYLVCKEPDCAEMRQFWKTLKIEREEKNRLEREKFLELLEIMFNDLLDELVANAVFQAEWKIHGCRCVKKPCYCFCNCMKWCKCCKCYKVPNHNAAPCECGKKLS